MFTASNKKRQASLHNNSVGSGAVGGSIYLINTEVTGMNWHFSGHTFVSQPKLTIQHLCSSLSLWYLPYCYHQLYFLFFTKENISFYRQEE